MGRMRKTGKKLLAALLAALALSTAALAAENKAVPETDQTPETATETEIAETGTGEVPKTEPEEPETEKVEPQPESETEEPENPEEQGEFHDIGIIPVDPIDENAEIETPVFLLEDFWKGSTFGDNLTGWAQTAYTTLDDAFAGRNGAMMTYGTCAYISGTPYCAYVHVGDPWTVTLSYAQESDYKANIAQVRNEEQPILLQAYYAFLYDHPEYYWIRTAGRPGVAAAGSYTDYGDHRDYEITYQRFVAYNVHTDYQNASVRSNLTSAVNAKVDEIVGRTEGEPVIARLADFDWWLAHNNAYNTPASEGTSWPTQTPWNILSGLRINEEMPVCEGYSKSFQLLCHEIGVPCLQISGSGHMWNAVQVDGQWYYMDCTWNDGKITIVDQSGNIIREEEPAYSSRKYFLIFKFDSGKDAAGHVIQMNLPTPTMADRDYFNPQKTNWYLDVSASGTAGASGLMGIYAGSGKLLQVQNADSFFWIEGTNRLITPEIPDSLRQQGNSAKLFAMDGHYKPTQAATPVNLT